MTQTPESKVPPLSQPSTDIQGEGNYDASRRHRESVERFVRAGRVEPAADAAAPRSEAEARDLKQAEEEGRSKARG
jgi:hypothetical protein